MSEKTPPALDRLWDSLEVGPPPVDALLTAGRTARRRRRRSVLAGVAAAVVLVVGGVAVGMHLLTAPGDPGPAGPAPVVPSTSAEVDAPVDADLEFLAQKFIGYALGDGDDLPVWESVTMALGGKVARSVDDVEAALGDRTIWQYCPADWLVYGASSCPVDVLGTIRSAETNETQLVISADPGEVACAPDRVGALPQGRLVAIRPEAGRRTCSEDFSLVLAANDRGELIAVDLTLSEP